MNATLSCFARYAPAALWVAVLTAPLSGQSYAFANGETTACGTVSGSYVATHENDQTYESITEVESTGKKNKRWSWLSHTWNFNVTPGSTITLFIKAYHSANTEGDHFRLLWSSTGSNFQPLLDLTKTSDDGNYQSAALPGTISGPIYIAVVDADRTSGNRSLDTVFVDDLYIKSVAGGPPSAPTDVVALDSSSSTIDLTWTDMSVDEFGFAIARFDGVTWTNAKIVEANVTFFRDSGLVPSTDYAYIVVAFNAVGDSPPSNTASATTRAVGAFAVERIDVIGDPLFTTDNSDHAYDLLTGHPAILYSDGPAWPSTEWIKLAQWNGSSWGIEVVANNGGGLSLAFKPRTSSTEPETLSFVREVEGTLWYHEKIGNTWQDPKEIDNRIAGNSTLAYDANREPAISYAVYSNGKVKAKLKLARRSNGSWSTDVIDNEPLGYSSLAFDQAGHPAIAYSTRDGSNPGIKLARWNGSSMSWDIELVEPPVPYGGLYVRLAFDPMTGWPAITHQSGLVEDTQVRFLHWDGDYWQVEVIAGRNGRLAYDVFGNAYLAHFNPTRLRLEVKRWNGLSMQSELVSVVHQGTYMRRIALRVDPVSNQPSVSWSDSWGLGFARK